ncbi:MAG: hypothetical protein ACUZ8H_09920 [Candidatus Anammoxibacter sp.]
MGTETITVDKRSALSEIVAKFPQIIAFRNNLVEFGVKVDRYLMLIGGNVAERSACIDFISSFSCKKPNSKSCGSKTGGMLKKEVIEMDGCSDLLATILQKISNNRADEITIDDKLFVLNDISCRRNDIWKEFGLRFNNPSLKPAFLVATIKDRNELEEIPQKWRDMFEEVYLPPMRAERRKRIVNFASKAGIDKILMKFIRRYPHKPRRFVVEKALPTINKIFAGRDIYCEGSLRTRISIVKQKMMI